MKAFVLILCVLSLGLVACSSPTPAGQDAVQNDAPSGAPLSMPAESVDDMFNTVCEEVADPQVLVDALPSEFAGLGVVGEVIAERDEMPMMDGQVQLSSLALKTLTVNDEYYVTLTAQDNCGFTLIKAGFKQTVPGVSDYGSVRALTISGNPAFLTKDTDRGAYALEVLVQNRLLVKVDADPEFGEANTLAIADKIDFNAIERAIP